MWANAHKLFVTLFAATQRVLLNKVIHRAVESLGNPKKIGYLPAILTFHFKFAGVGLMASSEAALAAYPKRCQG
jgi:hypothetical protein